MLKKAKAADLKKYIKSGGSIDEIVEFFGYSSRSAIQKWMYRNGVPKFQEKRLAEFLNGKRN